MPARSDKPTRPYDACRIHGELTLNKVAGNLHVISGKTVNFPRGHVHITVESASRNFSHRINRFSFGDATRSLVHPLEGDEKVLHDDTMMAQYFIEVVPTEIRSFLRKWHTYQYSVRENVRPVQASMSETHIPGLYFKYDMAALGVTAEQNRVNMLSFGVRLASVISGIVVISGALNTALQMAMQALRIGVSAETKVSKTVKATGVATVAGADGGANVRSNLLLNAQLPDGYACDLTAPTLTAGI